MSASKKHRGLGRGLDALIPITETSEEMDKEQTRTSDSGIQKESDTLNPNKAVSAESKSSEEGEINEYIHLLKITKIEPNRDQPRKQFDQEKLEELSESISNKGLLEPIIVRQVSDHYEIIAGERRWRAAKLAGLKEIPAIIRSYDELERIEVSLIENIQRENLNPMEEARAYRILTDEFHLKQEEIARKVSRNRTSIANSMRLLKLSEPVQKMVEEGKLSMGHARALVPIEDEELQIRLAEKIIEDNLSVREVENLIKKLNAPKNETPTEKEKTKDESMQTIYKNIAARMNESLGMKVRIQQKGENGGKLEIQFEGKDDLEKLMDLLMKA